MTPPVALVAPHCPSLAPAEDDDLTLMQIDCISTVVELVGADRLGPGGSRAAAAQDAFPG